MIWLICALNLIWVVGVVIDVHIVPLLVLQVVLIVLTVRAIFRHRKTNQEGNSLVTRDRTPGVGVRRQA